MGWLIGAVAGAGEGACRIAGLMSTRHTQLMLPIVLYRRPVALWRATALARPTRGGIRVPILNHPVPPIARACAARHKPARGLESRDRERLGVVAGDDRVRALVVRAPDHERHLVSNRPAIRLYGD